MICFDRFSTDFVGFTGLCDFFFFFIPHLSFREGESCGEEGETLSPKKAPPSYGGDAQAFVLIAPSSGKWGLLPGARPAEEAN